MDTVNDFCFQLPERLENDRVKLNPFIPSKHANLFMDQAILYPEIFHYLPMEPFKSADDFMENFYETSVRKNPSHILFAIFDKTKRKTNLNNDNTLRAPEEEGSIEGPLAGIIGLINASPIHLVTEITLIILPPFQRSHISSNATGLLLEYTLNLPSESPPGLGLRRVVWNANALNKASIGLAERMGFKLEGVLRWEKALPPGKEETGRRSREGDPRHDCVGMDGISLALCWDDWVDGGKEKVILAMQRAR